MIKILVVEDDEKLNFAVCKHLSYHSYSAKGVYDGNAALKALDAEKFDLIISDIMMPNIDLLAVLLVEAHRIRIVDEFAHDARLTARVQYIREDILLVAVIAPAVNDVVADSFCERAVRLAFEFLDVGKSKFHHAASSNSSRYTRSNMPPYSK